MRQQRQNNYLLWIVVAMILFVGFVASNKPASPPDPNTPYKSDSPYAPTLETQRTIDTFQGTRADKENAKRAVERFNEENAKRGGRPVGW